MAVEIVSARAASTDLQEEAAAAFHERWPEFVFHDPIPPRYIGRVNEYFGDYDLLLLDNGRVAAGGWGVPISWDGTPDDLPEGYDAALVASVEGYEAGLMPNTLSIMGGVVASGYEKQGLSRRILEALIDRATGAGLSRIVAPVRPTEKHKHPHVSMSEYATWTGEDGLSVDPWIRTHQQMGATILRPAPNSMTVTGTVTQWEAWAEMSFPVSGSYVAVPDALNLIEVDRGGDLAIYREENLWMRHR